MNLDREIEELLAVDHSPELVAKVRARVAAQPAPRSAWLSWTLAPVGAGLAAAAVAAAVWLPGAATTVSVVPPPPAPVIQSAAAPVAPDTPVPDVRDALPAPSPVRAAARRATAAASPEILISPEDARAFRLLLTRVREGLVVALPDGLQEEAVVGPPWIEIAPVVIEPLAHVAQDEGGLQ